MAPTGPPRPPPGAPSVPAIQAPCGPCAWTLLRAFTEANLSLLSFPLKPCKVPTAVHDERQQRGNQCPFMGDTSPTASLRAHPGAPAQAALSPGVLLPIMGELCPSWRWDFDVSVMEWASNHCPILPDGGISDLQLSLLR